MEINKIIHGHVLEKIKEIPDESIDCVITSPPYFGLRSYLPKDHPDKSKEIGSEAGIEEHLKVLTAVISEIKRVLKPTGNFWLNYGDAYGTNSGGMAQLARGDETQYGKINYDIGAYGVDQNHKGKNLEKSLMMLPERIALRMLDDGWILRNKIVWAKQILDWKEKRTKGSVMPTSVKDRFNTSWEYLFHFVKNKKYYFDLDSVRIPVQTLENRAMGIDREKEYPNAKRNSFAFNYRVRDAVKKQGQPQFKASEEEVRNYKITKENTPTFPHKEGRLNEYNNSVGKNLPNVWLIGIEPSKELHFARFPTALCEIPILVSCPKGGIVLDPFCGSGTALQVAQRLGRIWIGIELNESYIEIAEKKLAQQVLNVF